MTLGNMRQLGVRTIEASCSRCHREAIVNVVARPCYGAVVRLIALTDVIVSPSQTKWPQS
jgi:hypothetical protein